VLAQFQAPAVQVQYGSERIRKINRLRAEACAGCSGRAGKVGGWLASVRKTTRQRNPGPHPQLTSGVGNSLSVDRKLDILGVVMALFGLLTLLSLLSSQNGAVYRAGGSTCLPNLQDGVLSFCQSP